MGAKVKIQMAVTRDRVRILEFEPHHCIQVNRESLAVKFQNDRSSFLKYVRNIQKK